MTVEVRQHGPLALGVCVDELLKGMARQQLHVVTTILRNPLESASPPPFTRPYWCLLFCPLNANLFPISRPDKRRETVWSNATLRVETAAPQGYSADARSGGANHARIIAWNSTVGQPVGTIVLFDSDSDEADAMSSGATVEEQLVPA